MHGRSESGGNARVRDRLVEGYACENLGGGAEATARSLTAVFLDDWELDGDGRV